MSGREGEDFINKPGSKHNIKIELYLRLHSHIVFKTSYALVTHGNRKNNNTINSLHPTPPLSLYLPAISRLFRLSKSPFFPFAHKHSPCLILHHQP